jgi:hypothetical protein
MLKISESNEKISVLASGSSKIITYINTEDKFVSYLGEEFESYSFLLPGGNGPLTPLPLLSDKSYPKDETRNKSKQASYAFSNPIRIYPSVDLTFGLAASDPALGGIILSDNSKDYDYEIVKISTNGTTGVTPSLEDLKKGFEQQMEQAAATIDSMKGELSKLDPSSDAYAELKAKMDEAETNYNDQVAETQDAITAANQAEAEEKAKEQAKEQAKEATAAEGAAADAAAAADAVQGAVDDAVGVVNDGIDAINGALAMLQSVIDTLSSIAMMANQLLEGLEAFGASLGPRPNDFTKANIRYIYIDKDTDIPTQYLIKKEDAGENKYVLTCRFEQVAAIKFNVPEIVDIKKHDPDSESISLRELKIETGDRLYIKTIGANRDTKIEIGGARVKARPLFRFKDGIYQNFVVKVPELSSINLFGSNPCISISITNSNENRMRLGRMAGNDLAVNLDQDWGKNIFGGKKAKKGPANELKGKLEDRFLKFTSVTLDKAAIAKEFMQSFCDFSFHLTAELQIQLNGFKVLLIPIKVIFCIIDVICALLHPIRLVFAIIRLFLCLYDLILLLPQLAVPAMYLALLLHLIELILCVILKILSIINAINEIIGALAVAIEEKNYPAIIALEETLSEHLFSLEGDISVLDPIITILAIFLELLQLAFAFPCQVGSEEDDEACIDPSQLAGLIIGKVAPKGRIEPDALLPLAQTYTTLPVDEVGTKGNTPPTKADENGEVENAENATVTNILNEVIETTGDIVVSNNSTFAGNTLPGLMDNSTGINFQVQEGGFFSGDTNGDGEIDNVNYQNLRFQDGDFDATFSLSFTKSVKQFAIFTGPDPRMVRFKFNERGITNQLGFIPFFLISMFFRKKTIDELQTLDSPPGFLTAEGNSLKVAENFDEVGLVSPIDGAADDFSVGGSGGFFLDQKTGGSTRTYQPKPLTVDIELNEPTVNLETFDPEFIPVTVTKTFGNIPMIALVDDEFNVYFVQEGDNGEGGIVVEEIDGVPCITSIHAKMINYPSAPKRKFSKEDREVYRSKEAMPAKSSRGISIEDKIEGEYEGLPAGQLIIYEQANANWALGITEVEAYYTKGGSEEEYIAYSKFNSDAESYNGSAGNKASDYKTDLYAGDLDLGVPLDPSEPPFPSAGIYDWSNAGKKEQKDLGNSIDAVKVFDFPNLYVFDVRQVADDIASACGASGPAELLLSLPGFETDFAPNIEDMNDCLEAFLGFFNSEKEKENGEPDGLIPLMRYKMGRGELPDKVDISKVLEQYETLKACIEDQIDKSCKFVINPLNTTFKLLGDEDETPLTGYVDPEQQDLASLIGHKIVDEVEIGEELEGFPSITGAMEYASGIGDTAIVVVGSKALVQIIPRDCYDDPIAKTLDLREKIKIDFVKDETGSADLVEVTEGAGDLIEKEDTVYTLAVGTENPGKVVIKATICSTVIQAVTDRGIIDTRGDDATGADCVDNITDDEDNDGVFAPGALMKVDRTLTILFIPKPPASDKYGDGDRDQSARSAKPGPQTFGTKLEN